jgi:hypothetical protein
MAPGPERQSLFERMSRIARGARSPISEVDQLRRPASTSKPSELPSRRLDP